MGNAVEEDKPKILLAAQTVEAVQEGIKEAEEETAAFRNKIKDLPQEEKTAAEQEELDESVYRTKATRLN